LQVATLAGDIARSHRLPPATINHVFLGGLLHDIGKLVLGCNFRPQYRQVLACPDAGAALEKERALFGTTHAEVGGYLLWLWGLPRTITDVVVRHHIRGPELPQPQDAASIVHLADLRAHQESPRAKHIL